MLSEQSLYPAGWIHVYILAFPYFMNLVFVAGSVEMKKKIAHTSYMLHPTEKINKLIPALDAFLVAACNLIHHLHIVFFLSFCS